MPELAQLPENWQANAGPLAANLAEQGRQMAMGGKPKDALDLFAKALSLDPKNICALVGSGAAAAECKLWDDSRRFTNTALEIVTHDKDAAVCWNNLGFTHYVRREYPDALKCLDRSIELDRFYKQPVVTKGAVLVLLDRLQEAYSLFDRANLMNPTDWEPIVNRGILNLLWGKWDLGLPGYEERKLVGEAAEIKWPVPRWKGEELNGRAVIIWPDQGLGDCIWAHRLVPEVQKQGGKVYLQVYPLLEEILPVPDGVTLVHAGEAIDNLHFHVPLMSLPYCLRLDGTNPPPPYGLTVKHEPLENGPPRIGLCWSGNINHKLDDLRSVRLADLRPLIAGLPADVQWFTLQHEVRHADRAAFDAIPFCNESPESFLQLAEVIATLDLVITVDTGVLHVAAEMGCPTWGLIPFAMDFRYGTHGETLPWYPALKMYRNRSPQARWNEVLSRIAHDLQEEFS